MCMPTVSRRKSRKKIGSSGDEGIKFLKFIIKYFCNYDTNWCLNHKFIISVMPYKIIIKQSLEKYLQALSIRLKSIKLPYLNWRRMFQTFLFLFKNKCQIKEIWWIYLNMLFLIRVLVIPGIKRTKDRHSHSWLSAFREIPSLIII